MAQNKDQVFVYHLKLINKQLSEIAVFEICMMLLKHI